MPNVFVLRPYGMLLLMSGSAIALTAGAALADTAPAASPDEITVIAKARAIAPSSAPLDAFEPTSTVQPDFLKNNIIPLASLDDVIKYQPSVWANNPNGPGIGKAETITLRGFQDGQYNMTFDGIPFGDSTDLHHTTSSLPIAHDLGGAEVDRGPGTGSTIGKATFGGTVGFVSKTPDAVGGPSLYGAIGTFDTYAAGVEIDTGPQDAGRGFYDLQNEQTHGYLSGSQEHRTNFMAKYVFTPSENTTETLLASYNEEFQYTTQGATLPEYATYGDKYGLCNNPGLQCYYRYQPSYYTSSFLYWDIKSKIGAVRVQNTLYNDSFEHDYWESKDASDNNASDNGVKEYNPTTLKKLACCTTDIPGKRADAQVDSFGDIFRAAVDTMFGELRTGFWLEEQDDKRYSYNTDINQYEAPDVGSKGTAYSYSYKDTGVTVQPYVELEWQPIPGLSVVPGVKFTSYRRWVDAAINKGTGASLQQAETWSEPQPSIEANYQIQKNWTAYAQVAKGFLAPPINVFQVNNITSLNPEETINYQAGTTWRSGKATLAADVYYIDFDNYLSSVTVGGLTSFTNAGGAIYQGVELEGQYALDNGLSFYGSYSANSAKYKNSDVTLAEAPEWMGTLGVLYQDRKGPYFSVIGKVIGPRWGDDGAGAGDVAATRIDTTTTVDFAGGYHFKNLSPTVKNLTVSLKVSNLFDSHKISDFAGYQSATNAPLYWITPGRSAFLNIESKF